MAEPAPDGRGTPDQPGAPVGICQDRIQARHREAGVQEAGAGGLGLAVVKGGLEEVDAHAAETCFQELLAIYVVHGALRPATGAFDERLGLGHAAHAEREIDQFRFAVAHLDVILSL